MLQNEPTVEVEGQTYGKGSYWKWNFFITVLPFVLCGAPVHALVSTKKSWENESVKSWLVSLRGSSRCYSLTSLLLLLLTLALNGSMFYFVGSTDIFNELIIQGKITKNLNSNLKLIFINLPFVLVVDYLWLFGYSLGKSLRSFDDSLNCTLQNLGDSSDLGPSCRKKLFLMYFLIVYQIVLNAFLIAHQVQNEGWSTGKLTTSSINYAVLVLYCCFLPLYASLCWGIRHQLQLVSGCIDSLIRWKVRLSHKHLPVLKECYRSIADNILYVNSLYSLTVSWVIVAIALSISGEAKGVIAYLSKIVFDNLSKVPTESPGLKADFTPDVVRYIVGHAINFCLYLALVGYTLWQVLLTNDDVRFFHVWLNDFASEMLKEGESGPDGELYRAVSAPSVNYEEIM